MGEYLVGVTGFELAPPCLSKHFIINFNLLLTEAKEIVVEVKKAVAGFA